MVKVTIRKLHAALTGASGLVLLNQAAVGCAAPPGEHVADTHSADTTIDPGTGTLTLVPTEWTPAAERWGFNAQGSVDEFVRVGESMTVSVSAFYLWQILHPNGSSTSPSAAELENLKVRVTVEFLANDVDVLSTAALPVVSWTGTDLYSLVGTTEAFRIPASTDTLAFLVSVTDPSDGSHVELADLDIDTVPVFGGDGTLRHVLFDNLSSTLRQRVVEGGGAIAGGTLDVTYTNWRADEIVDKSSLDTEIGTANSYTRFGSTQIPIYGQLTYEVWMGYSFDGTNWFEYPLAATTSSRVLNAFGRTAYENSFGIPATGTSEVQAYFHVKAYLVVDYGPWGNSVATKRYNQGDRILLRERWDNLNGQVDSNYVVPVQASP
jgi:hypothetical protein